MESLLSGGYSSAHSRLRFDTEMFTPKSPEYIKEKDEIIEQMRNLYGEKNAKKKKKEKSQSEALRSVQTGGSKQLQQTDLKLASRWRGTE